MPSKIHSFFKQNWSFLSLSLLYALWALAFIWHASYIASDGKLYFALFDDAMISMRYAWNLSHGNGLVWNPGEYVEGYTNLLMTLLMTLATGLFEKRYAVLFIQLTGLPFVLATAFLALNIFRRFTANRLAGHILFVLILLYYPLSYWSLMGMETGLLAVLLGGGVLLSLRYAETGNKKDLWGMVVCFGLAYLTRNESLLLASLAFAYLLPAFLRERKSMPLFFTAGLAYGAFAVGQTLFRYFYYGDIVPNTYTLKLVGMPVMLRLQNGLGFMNLYFSETWIFIIAAIAGLFIKPNFKKTYLTALFIVSALYQIYVGGDAWPYWRITAPAMPFLFIGFVLSLDSLPKKMHMPILILAAGIGLFFADSRFFPELNLSELPYQHDYAHAHIEDSIAILTLTDEEATIGVYWAGTMPYYTGRKAVDFLGKSDKYIASLPPDLSGQIEKYGMSSMPGHNKYDLTYSIQTLQPTYVEEFDWGSQKLTGWARDHYVRVKFGKSKLHFLKDSPHVKWSEIKDYLQW